MYLPRSEPPRGRESRTLPPPVELGRKTAPALYRSAHFEDPSSLLSAEDVELAKRLCHRIDGEGWPRLYAAFFDELSQALAEREHGATPQHPGLEPDWSAEPWCYVRPEEAPAGEVEGADGPPGLVEARRLGFRNVALLGSLDGLDLDRVGSAAQALGLRVTTELTLDEVAHRIHEPSWLAGTLRVVASEVRRGVMGVRTHGIDRVDLSASAPEGGSPSGHAFQALLKLFLRTLEPEEIVVPELQRPSQEAQLQAGGALELRGLSAPAEGDLVHWFEGMSALRAALARGDRAPLDEVLAAPPVLLHGARRLCSLEHHDTPGTLLELVGTSAERLALAFALLYAMPATPAVYAKAARALPAGRATLRSLNRLRRSSTALSHGDLTALGATRPEALLWLRGRPEAPGAPLVLAANLSERPLALEVAPTTLERAGLAGLRALLDANGRSVAVAAAGQALRLGLPPFGFVLCRGVWAGVGPAPPSELD